MRIDSLIYALIDGTAPIWSLLAFVALLFMSTVNIRGKIRRRFLTKSASMVMLNRRTVAHKAYRAQRAADFLDLALHRCYYLVGVVSLGMLWGLPFLPMSETARALLWASFSGLAFVSPGIMYLNYRNRDDDGEIQTRKRLEEAEVLSTTPRIVAMVDEITGLYTPQFWLGALKLRAGGKLRRPMPVTCLVLELPDLSRIRVHYGDSVANEIVAQFASYLRNNVRREDLLCRVRYDRFAVALSHCPRDAASRIGRGIVHNSSRLTIVGDDAPLTVILRIQWASATSPGYGIDADQLLDAAIASLNRGFERTSRDLSSWPEQQSQIAA